LAFVVPTPDQRTFKPPKAKVAFPLHLNTASAETLEALPGVGPVLAHRIVAYRTQHGGRFTTLDELDEVKGIGSKKLARFKPLLVLE
jgi:competence protein ComEA